MARNSRPPTPSTPDTLPIGMLIAVARTRLKRRLQRDLNCHRVTPAQMGALFWIADDEGLTASDLAERMLIDLPTITRVLDRLQRARLVARRRDGADRRRVRVWLTEKGRALVPRLRPVAESVNRELLKHIDDAQERSLRRVLRQLIQNLEEENP